MKPIKFLLLLLLLALSGYLLANPTSLPGDIEVDSMANQVKNCRGHFDIDIKLNTKSNPSSPEIIDKKLKNVCVHSGGTVVFHRKGKGNQNGFNIFAKDKSWQLKSTGNKLVYRAPQVSQRREVIYGISMPDADVDLDPIIIITPGISGQ